MTAQTFMSELTNLIQESKRKNPELKQAAETSLSEIKGIQVTSEKQLAADLSRRPQFVNPFLLACSSRNVKLATIGMSCLQRLSASQALSKTKLKDVLEAMTECTSLGQEIQLKILQTLPSLLQNYADQLSGPSLFTILQICSTLQTSKISSVSGTSAATLQQLVTSLYEKLAIEDEKDLEVPAVVDIQVGEETIRVRTVAGDAFKVFHDLCMLAEGSKPRYIRFAQTSEQLLLELIESIFTGHAEVINKHREQAHLVKSVLIPYLIKVFSDKGSFSITVRATRLLYLIVKHHLELFPAECETILEWFNHSLDPDTTLAWKRILCLEVFREIFSDPLLVIRIHSKFDSKEENKPIIPDCLASFVRIASEKPGIIGLGQFSTVPTGNYFQRELAADHSEDLSQPPGVSAGVPTNAVPGISVQFSSVRTPCIEQLDKQEPPTVPETYAYSLVLSSLNNLSESLSKFIQQMTISGREKQKKHQKRASEDAPAPEDDEERPKRPTRRRTGSYRRGTTSNSLSSEDHPAVHDIKTATSLIDQSWPAILASCSTFFNASLDADHYRGLVRAFQKFTQVSGLLHMNVPRDAFLTTLGKSAMPQNPMTAAISSAGSQPPPTPSFLGNAKGLLSVETIVNQASSFLPDRRRQSIDSGEPTLNVRHLLCLRALLNIAIALGPTLDNAWRIVLETLQQADRVLASSGKSLRDIKAMAQQSPNPNEGSAQLGSEVAAVQAAASRLLESTAEFPDSAFIHALRALCSLVDARNTKPIPATVGSPAPPGHKPRIASFSGLSVKTGVQDNDYVFTLLKMRELAQLNLERFVLGEDEESSGWNLLLGELVSIATTSEVPGNSRLLAASIIRQVVLDSLSFPLGEDRELIAAVQERALAPLRSICVIFNEQGIKGNQVDDAAIEAHDIILETLRSLLEQTGEGLVRGWQAVFDIILTAFVLSKPELDDEIPKHESEIISVKIGRSAFNSLQLICSDFMTAKLNPSMGTLIEILYHFASQDQDLNISLTTTTFFWNVSDFLYASMELNSLEKLSTQKDLNLFDSFVETIQTKSESEFIPATWLYLLRRLTDLISDGKHEVRNGAVHTALRIFDNHGDDFSPNVWQLSLEAILLRMIDLDISTYQVICSEATAYDQEQSEILKSKIGTSKILLQDSSKLLADYLEPISKATKFKQLWTHLMSSLTKYQSFELHELTGAAFTALNVIMTKASQSTYLDSSSIEKASAVWDENFPAAQSKLGIGSNLEAYEAYVASLKSIYKFRKDTITTEKTEQIVNNLERCIRESESPSYSSDLDSLPDLHNQVILCVAELRTDLKGATSIVLGMLARFIGLPLHAPEPSQRGGLTYIALSKASMTLVQSLIKEDAPWPELLHSDALQLVLKNLEKSIRLKYRKLKQGRNPPLWKKATSTAVALLEKTLPRVFDHKLSQIELRNYWDTTVGIANNIVHADVSTLFSAQDGSTNIVIPGLAEDEEFDIAALTKLNELVVPALGDAVIPDPIRRTFARSLFTASLVHHRNSQALKEEEEQEEGEEEGDLPPRLDAEPLANLYAIRPGRTFDERPVVREDMAYTCFRTLLDLLRSREKDSSTNGADSSESSEEYIRLAQAAAPYVILRAALPLKTYVADQPLRGKMPMPATQVRELVTVLSELGKLRCERKAIPPTEGVKSGEGGQLVHLYPLVVKAAGVKNSPRDVKKVLERWLVRLGEQLGVEE